MVEVEEILTRVVIISDTRLNWSDDVSIVSALGKSVPPGDVLIHCGNLTTTGLMEEHQSALELLESSTASIKLVIAGDHDISLDESYYHAPVAHLPYKTLGEHIQGDRYDNDMPQRVRNLWTSPRAKAASIYYLCEGVYEFGLDNGARLTVYASPWQPQRNNLAFNYPHNHDRWNQPRLSAPDATNSAMSPIPDVRIWAGDYSNGVDLPVVDMVITHGPARGRLDILNGQSVGCEHLLRALARVRPRLHVCGNIYESWGMERVEWRDDSSDDSADATTDTSNTTNTTNMTDTADTTNTANTANTANTTNTTSTTDTTDTFVRRAELLASHASFVNALYRAHSIGTWILGFRSGDETTFVNATMKDPESELTHCPVMLDVPLPKAHGPRTVWYRSKEGEME